MLWARFLFEREIALGAMSIPAIDSEGKGDRGVVSWA